jgi:hypothetical protein
MAERIRLRRTRGWRKPENAVVVARPGRWGNPFIVGQTIPDGLIPGLFAFQSIRIPGLDVDELNPDHAVLNADHAVALYRAWLDTQPELVETARRELAGRDLCCWCPPGVACHADVLLTVANPPQPTAALVAEVIGRHSYRYAREADLQQGIADALTAAGLPARREVRLSPHDVIDLMSGHVGVEVKLSGRLPEVAGQLGRYAAHPDVAELVLVTTRAPHRAAPPDLDGTPLRVVWLSGGLR